MHWLPIVIGVIMGALGAATYVTGSKMMDNALRHLDDALRHLDSAQAHEREAQRLVADARRIAGLPAED